MVSTDNFRHELLAQMGRAFDQGFADILINSGELHRAAGGYPGSAHGIPICCEAMHDEMKLGDILLVQREHGSGMTVRYFLPRAVGV